MSQAVEERVGRRVKHEPVEHGQRVEYGDQADRIRRENKEKQRENQGGPRHHPLAPNVRLGNVVPHKFNNSFETVHETGRHQPVLAEVSPHAKCDDQEYQRGHKPQHEHMFGYREIDSKHARQLD